jgi:tetratricopeptide (TPR) repeat protein
MRRGFLISVATALVCCVGAVGQQVPGSSTQGQYDGGIRAGSENIFFYASVEIDVRGPGGQAVGGPVYVSLLKETGQVLMTSMAEGGKASFSNVPKSELVAQVVASGYDTAKKSFQVLDSRKVELKIELKPMSDREAAAADRGISALNPKAQKDIGRALQALRANNASGARQNLEAAQRYAPNSAEVEYLFGVCASQSNDAKSAQSYWSRALELNPSHLGSLVAISQSLLQEHRPAEALPYIQRAIQEEPLSWRAHLLLAQADLFQGKHEDAVKEAERALELGYGQAASAEPLLAHALYENGDKDRAMRTLQSYVKTHPNDANAAKLLERMEKPETVNASGGGAVGVEVTDVSAAASTLPVASNWLPPNVDEKIPPVEAGEACSLQDVVEKAGAQLVAFVHEVDRFTATEFVTHKSINRYGMTSSPEKRVFDYSVTIQDIRPGYLGVTEYRNGGGAQTDFPGGIVTSGLPALVLVFHPYYAPNYEMACEGLARANGTLAWQVHFRQKPGKPNAIKSYQFGLGGPSYPVALKGRAWISADNYQIIRMETDIVAPLPQIKLEAEHSEIEYGPVKFQRANETLWLPQSADVYVAWQGRQMHRRHSFSNYLLFSVEENEKIGAPRNADSQQPEGKN